MCAAAVFDCLPEFFTFAGAIGGVFLTLRLVSALVLTAVCGAATIAEAQQRVTATALVQTYDQNEIRAEMLYEGGKTLALRTDSVGWSESN